jgi:flagellin
MSMVINHNLSALNTFNQLNKNSNLMNSSLEKLSSGYRINSAADDAAGLSISEKMRAQIRGLNKASDNSQTAISLIQTAEGGLEETDSILQRMRELATQAANGTNSDSELANIQDEISALTEAIDEIGNDTQFNNKNLLNGALGIAATVTGDSAAYKVKGGTADTKAGNMVTLTSATAATAASIATTTTYASASATLTAASKITVNGVAFSFEAGASVQNVLDAVNKAGIGVTATLDTNGKINFTSNEVGSAAQIKVDVAGTGDFAGLAAGTTAGTDASIAIDAASAAAAGSYIAKGNTITITSGTLKGLTFDVTQSTTTASTITVDTNGSLTFQIGANEGQTMGLGISDMRAAALGVDAVDVTKNAASAITTVEKAIEAVSAQRSKLGAAQNRLESTINNLSTTSENLTSAESLIRDVDMASEMANYTKLSTITQAATAMLAQANQQPQQVLKLLQ